MTVPTYRPKIWAEIWKRPGHATFGKVINELPVNRGSITARGNGVGEGSAEVPSNYGRLDEILKPDPTTPANAVSSLVRIFQEDVSTPIAEWLPAEMTGADSKDDSTVTVKGADIMSILGYARVEAWDWDGTDDHHSFWPDWIYGGRNVLGDLMAACDPAITAIYVTASSGNFTLGVSFNGGAIQTTGNIAWNASAATVEAALEALSNVDDVQVSGSGTSAEPWRIQTVTPCGEYVISTNVGTLSGGTIIQDRETIGGLIPEGWTTSFNPLTNLEHGQVDEFRLSTFTSPDPSAPACNTDGYAVFFNPGVGGLGFPGVQKIVPVKPGGRYHATVTAWATTSAPVRFVIRDIRENCIAANPSCDTSVTLTGSTWTELTIPTITIPTDVDRVIVRFATTNAATTASFFITCVELREGMPPTTWGNIWTQLYLDATSDHASREVWQIGAGATNYLTLDFSTTLDSAGAAWTHPEVAITLKRGQSYLRVGSECFKQGYEGRIVPNDVTAGTWKFQLYNPGTAGTVLNSASSPVIMGGRDVTKRDVRKFLPTYTDWAVEAGGQNIARERSTTAISALGRIEGYTPNQDLGTLTEAGQAASTALTAGLQQSQSLTYTVVGVQGAHPLVDYKVFDTINVDDPPDVPKVARRIKQIQLAWDKTGVESTIQLGAESYVGVGAIYEGVNTLLKEFKAIRDRPDEPTDILNYFPGLLRPGALPPIVIAAVDTRPLLKTYANYICDGVDDQDTIAQAVEDINLNNAFFNYTGSFGTILFLDGTYTFDDRLALAADGFGKLHFVGDGTPTFVKSYDTVGGDGFSPLIGFVDNGTTPTYMTIRFTNIRFDGASLTNAFGTCFFQSGLSLKPIVHVDRCVFLNWENWLWWAERRISNFFTNNTVFNCPLTAAFVYDSFAAGYSMIGGNVFENCSGNMVAGLGSDNHTLIHDNIQWLGTMVLNAQGGVTYQDNLF